MRVSKSYVALVIATLVLMLGAPTWAGSGAGTGLASSTHDWSEGSHASKFTGGVGMCTYCHTPHSAQTTLLLWNQTLSSNTFSWDVPTTTAGTSFATFSGLTYKGSSTKCLSCHDGSVAIGDFQLFEGTGEVVGTPNPTITVGKGMGASIYRIGASGNMAGNHPTAMPYPYQQQQNTYNGVTTGAAYIVDEWQMTPVSPVRLYNDDGSGDITGGPVTMKSGIECTSCHDVHNDKNVADPSGKNYFVLGTLSGNDTGYICLKCHIK